jgi:thiamine-phosphate pyrophosphorylase
LLRKSRLYVILDKKTCGRKSLLDTARKIKSAGAHIIQLRDKLSDRKTILKEALLLQGLLRNSRTLFIVNDYPDLAKIVDADGVHLGQGDISIKNARLILGNNKIIGISCHNLKQAQKAREEGADYIGVGPVFPTPTKPEGRALGLGVLEEINKKIKIPLFAIGDINKSNITGVLAYADKRIAVCRAVLKARDIAKNINEFLRLLN